MAILTRRARVRPVAPDWHVGIALLASLATWQLVDQLQSVLPLSGSWALLDELGHASVAAGVMLWTVPAWGWQPTLAAVLAGTLIDVDHPLAAGSVLPSHMMSLAARPASHSLLGVGIASAVGLALGGRRIGFAALVGVLTHIVRDATADPGVPLLVPMVDNWHVRLPIWSLPVLMLILIGAGLVGSALTASHVALTRRKARVP
jgi:membrane-bound metal-dependent hydrolase YbcI (DUF457 family)